MAMEEVRRVAQELTLKSGKSGFSHPLQLARAAGLELIARPGPLAILDGETLYFDDARDGWREAVATLTYGWILRCADCPDTFETRRMLSSLFSLPMPVAECWGDISTAYC